jgi:hypothetical protein
MLRNVGYSVEQKLFQQNSICDKLRKLANNDDDKFYRLCLYLFRRSTEYHFLNVSHEVFDYIYFVEYFSLNMS